MATKADHIRKGSSPPEAGITLIGSYILAESAKTKLKRESIQKELHLNKLVGHANMLDSLLLSIADKEQQRDAR
jgi:hypothetical protein